MTGAHPLTSAPWRTRIEQAVSEHLGRPWILADFDDLVDKASHPCGVLSDGAFAVFAKLTTGENAPDQLAMELAGLQLVREKCGVATPAPVAVLPGEREAVIVLEAAREIPKGPQQWREIGRVLARMHSIHASLPGLAHHNYLGPLYQDNRPMADWPTFYTERRLWPRLIQAINRGVLTLGQVRQIERVIARLPELCGPPVTPVLLHGDAQRNNFVSTVDGALVIDTAVHYGHPELDLAYLGYWQEVPEDVFDGYREILPIDPGFATRRELWRLSVWLVVEAFDGSPTYVPRLMEMVAPYC